MQRMTQQGNNGKKRSRYMEWDRTYTCLIKHYFKVAFALHDITLHFGNIKFK